MAIQVRRGLKADFDPNKLLPGEFAAPLDTKELYLAYGAGDVKRMATYEDMVSNIKEATDEISSELIEGVEIATENAINATSSANNAAVNANVQAELADQASDRANAAAELVENLTIDIIDDVVVSFEESETDTDIESEDTVTTLFGKLLKNIKTLRTGLVGKIGTGKIVNNLLATDTTTVLGGPMGKLLDEKITDVNNNLTALGDKVSWVNGAQVIEDLNNYVATGIYTYNGWLSDLLNKPVNNRLGNLIVSNYGLDVSQTIIDELGVIYCRKLVGTNPWGDWVNNDLIRTKTTAIPDGITIITQLIEQRAGIVHVAIQFTASTTIAPWTTIATIPPGYRPANTYYTDGSTQFFVRSDGLIQPTVELSTSGVQYRIDTTFMVS